MQARHSRPPLTFNHSTSSPRQRVPRPSTMRGGRPPRCAGLDRVLLLLAAALTPSALAFLAPAAPAWRQGVPGTQAAAPVAIGGAARPSLVLASSPRPVSADGAATEDLVTTLEKDGRFGRLTQLLRLAKLDGTLAQGGPWTLLAPTDAALDDAGFNLTLSVASQEPQRVLSRILSYHVIPEKVGLTELVYSGDTRVRIKTLERSGLSVAVYGGSVLVDETRVTEWGIEASNGVIHALDGLLQPVIPGFEPYSQAGGQARGPPPGVTPPLGFFDPLGFWEGKPQREQGRLRAAELRHGRLAMLAAVGILAQELLQPGHPAALSALSALSSSSATPPPLPLGLPPVAAVLLALLPGAAYEAYQRASAAQSAAASVAPLKTESLTRILEAESPDFEAERAERQARWELETKELNNGRLAMVAVLGILGQELATGQGIVAGWLLH